MTSDNRAISFIQSINKCARRWNHLTRQQKEMLLMVARTADDLSEKFVLRNIARIKRQKTEAV